MHEDDVKDILRFIKNNRTVIIKDIAMLIKKESRYTQAFLDALEGAGLIESELKGTMKIITLTDRGAELIS
ncbi:MAG: hypothetical protein Q8M92_04365 [Candidatus Subteraquimicrobiales bacterium]|nr:hypothetical protein [Candidatus Subteraquimicrobiales bacterium]